MILSNCSWDNNLGINLFYILCGFILTIFKAGLHYILYFRMILLGIIIAITPLIIIVDEIMKFRGNEGILKKWLVFYLKILAFRPLLQIVYTVLGKLNKTPIEENPFYIMLIVLVLTAIFVVYMFSMFKGKNKKSCSHLNNLVINNNQIFFVYLPLFIGFCSHSEGSSLKIVLLNFSLL